MGLNNQAWTSVVVPAQPPRRSLDDLVGGYRRIPVLQIGAQFYCDSQLAFEALSGTHSDALALSTLMMRHCVVGQRRIFSLR